MTEPQPAVDAVEEPDALLADEAVALVARWLTPAGDHEVTVKEAAAAARLRDLVEDPDGVAFAMTFCDRIIRPDDDRVAATQLRSLLAERGCPGFLSAVDRLLLRTGGRMSRTFPRVVMPLARRRLRALVGHLVVDADDASLGRHLRDGAADGVRPNVNLLGEAVLGEDEARRRRDALLDLLQRPDVSYVSVKVSAVVSQINLWADDETRTRIVDRLRPLYAVAATSQPAKFLNLDMEEYKDLRLTVDVFRCLLDEPAFEALEAGIVLQAYLPDSFGVLQELTTWAEDRHRRTGAGIKVRIVKGANLAMERVDAELHGWEQAPYDTKAEVDANYKRLVDWLTAPERSGAVRVGVASHNLFDVAWAHVLARHRGVSDRIDVEMLQGMAPEQAAVVQDAAGGLVLYTPVVSPDEFDVAISYLFRRLEENGNDEGFLRHLFSIRPGTLAFEDQARRFRAAVEQRWSVEHLPRRRQDRSTPPERVVQPDHFVNESDTDPSLPGNRQWARDALSGGFDGARTSVTSTIEGVDVAVARAVAGQRAWWSRPLEERRRLLLGAAEELAARRDRLLTVMAHEAGKTVAEADPEVSEAIDFARWYADRSLELADVTGARFEPLGVVVVAPPWNFPVAIPAGGVFAALAAGNAAIVKPAPETPGCVEVVAEAAWAAGVPPDALIVLRTPDDDVGRHLITHPDVGGIILTGSIETAELFQRWRPERPLFAETSGKNSLVVTPNADLDLAVADLIRSAFGHAGQKCSAASLVICVGGVERQDRFRRQLLDAARSLVVGPADDVATVMGPLIGPPGEKLRAGLTELAAGERWLLEPRQLDTEGRLWSPGIRDGVRPGSAFHVTEYFGPVLGIMAARDLDQAIEWANATPYGLTGGIHSLERQEVERWLERIEVGNAYVNRHTTGAIVQRQPFGGWKRSAVGPGAKAGGPDYLLQLGHWSPAEPTAAGSELSPAVSSLLERVLPTMVERDGVWLRQALSDDERWWGRQYGVEHDPSGLVCEANVLRYRARPDVVVRATTGVPERDLVRVVAAGVRCGADVDVSVAEPSPMAALLDATVEGDDEFARSLVGRSVQRIRHLGPVPSGLRSAALDRGVDVVNQAVTASGRIELMWFLREQSISRTLHRYGNVVADA